MNIQEAKEEIARTYRAYQKKNSDGSFRIPLEKQRPILLIGPPGIGKTAIMKQIAEETGCGLISYSMTHHTRQSAIGLPFIEKREYGGISYSVTEYTMSEIVASVYDYMRATGKNSGILFLDEINCVSETLTPVMLQLLQNKTFGNVPLPEGWIIVTAGNPPEYNKSVRDFDMVTLDRVKNMEISADVRVWQSYARERGIHPAIRTYLSLYPDHFYNITNTDRGQLFVTARGWEDLSCMLLSYEEDGEKVDAGFFLQYLQHDDIARSFSVYYELFRSFMSAEEKNTVSREAYEDTDAVFANILAMNKERLAALSQTECLAVAAILFHDVQIEAQKRSRELADLTRLAELVGLIPGNCDFAVERQRNEFFEGKRKALAVKAGHGLMKPDEEFREKYVLNRMEQDAIAWLKTSSGRVAASEGELFSVHENRVISAQREQFGESAAGIVSKIGTAYDVLSKCPQGEGALMYFTTDLSGDPDTSALLAENPLPIYLEWCGKALMID